MRGLVNEDEDVELVQLIADHEEVVDLAVLEGGYFAVVVGVALCGLAGRAHLA